VWFLRRNRKKRAAQRDVALASVDQWLEKAAIVEDLFDRLKPWEGVAAVVQREPAG
jgi:hypothetical protein